MFEDKIIELLGDNQDDPIFFKSALSNKEISGIWIENSEIFCLAYCRYIPFNTFNDEIKLEILIAIENGNFFIDETFQGY